MKKIPVYLALFHLSLVSYGQTSPKKDNILEKILYTKYSAFRSYIETPDYNIQILYTQIRRDKNNQPSLHTYKYKVDSRNYIYPASTVKLPVILASLEKVNNINQSYQDDIITKESKMVNVAGKFCLEQGVGSIAEYAERILLVSDNPSFARLYEFLGQKSLNDALAKKGYDSIRIVRRLSSSCYTEKQNTCTNAVNFYNTKGIPSYQQPEICNDSVPKPIFPSITVGKAHIDAFGKFQNAPLQFTHSNFMPLSQLHQITIAALMPEALKTSQTFNLTEEDYEFLRRFMGAFPREGLKSAYLPENGYYDAYKKYFLYGQSPYAAIKPNIRIFNIVGLAYGFLIDSAYIVDFDNDIEFFLTASIYTNRDQILNDDNYEYNSEGIPFMKLLGETIYQYELAKEKKYKPDLKKFNIF